MKFVLVDKHNKLFSISIFRSKKSAMKNAKLWGSEKYVKIMRLVKP